MGYVHICDICRKQKDRYSELQYYAHQQSSNYNQEYSICVTCDYQYKLLLKEFIERRYAESNR